MKARLFAECPACQEHFQLHTLHGDGGAFWVECPSCQRKLTMDLTRPQIPSSLPHGERCPKCAASREKKTESCPKCGLVFEKWQGPQELFSDRAALQKRWATVRELPMDDSAHFDFLELCYKEGALNDAVQAYKELGERTGQDVSAKIRQLEILAQMSVAGKPAPRRKSAGGSRCSCSSCFSLLLG